MSREFNRCAAALFAKGMTELGFTPDKATGPLAWPGEKLFKAPKDGPTCWFSFFPNHKGYNEFHLEFIWSAESTFPAHLTSRPTPRAVPPECFNELRSGFLRLAALAVPPRGSWALEEPALLRELTRNDADLLVPPLVRQSLECVSTIGLQLLEEARTGRQMAQPQGGQAQV